MTFSDFSLTRIHFSVKKQSETKIFFKRNLATNTESDTGTLQRKLNEHHS